MDIDQLKKLLTDIQDVPRIEPPEVTLLSIGGKGYYEKPTTDVLAFFCDSSGSHGLGNLVINALFNSLFGQPDFHDFTVISEPQREVRTPDGKWIDLLLEGNDWVMLIENKIFHHQNNPFIAYENYIKEHKRFAEKQPVFVVLSPTGDAPDGWQGLSYKSLLESMKNELAQAFINQPLNKWLVLLRDFILHLEGIMSNPATPEETLDFVLTHLDEIRQAQEMKDQAVADFQREICKYLEENFPDKEVGYKTSNWSGFPVLRFYFEDWESASDVVLFLNGAPNESFYINYYACNLGGEDQSDQADEHLKTDCEDSWNERNKTIRGYNFRLKTKDKVVIKESLSQRMALLDKFETQIRTQW